ncbi:hypothetical protein BDV95DRAFT_46223 [Massariosphaeria phaeospora]|uniref:Uncharacterized protein n=1 Tax=Massariosphaeria phaeospora TaxID=100035 RepID=A0A7C8MKQ0_9PLEO|nr:hypothetical protein BDV95DRAFT_46223 [Massariosphaeria phaeospora]
MLHTIRQRITYLTYFIFTASGVLLGLSIAEVALESRVLRVFRNLNIQVPGSSIAEWLFVSLNPQNLRTGPSDGIFIVGVFGIVASLLGLAWMGSVWYGVREQRQLNRIGLVTCAGFVVNLVVALSILTYVFVVESKETLPRYFNKDWMRHLFTHEYYICEAFPSLVNNAEDYYGFAACGVAQAARYEIIVIALASVLLTALGMLQAHKSGIHRKLKWDPDVEKGLPSKAGVREGYRLGHYYRSRVQSPVAPLSAKNRDAAGIQTPRAALMSHRISIVGYYAKL